MQCIRCGKENPAGLRFCQDCGTGLEPPSTPRSVLTEAGTGTVALSSEADTKPAPPQAVDTGGSAVSSRLRPEVPNFDFTNRKSITSGPCSRCGAIVELKHAFCPQCGASIVSANSPIADAAHNSMPPLRFDRSRSIESSEPLAPSAQGTDQPAATCPYCGVSVIRGASNCPQCGRGLINSEPTGPKSIQSATNDAGHSDVATVRPPIDNSPVQHAKSPDVDLTPRLVMLGQDGSVQKVISLSDERVDLGRCEGEILLPDDTFLSNRHARFAGRDAVRTMTDLQSVNGIYLKLRGITSLSDGDMFLVGLQLLEFRLESPEMANLTPIRIAGCSLFGSSTSPRYARLSERTSDGAPRSVFAVGRDETILGREVGDIVFSGDPFMSRRHAALTRDPTDGTFTLRDLGSSNGTFLRVRGKVELEPGDHLRIGQHLFRYEMDNP